VVGLEADPRPALGVAAGRPRVVADLVVADGGVGRQPVVGEAAQPVAVVDARSLLQRPLALVGGAVGAERVDPGLVLAPLALDEVAGHQERLGLMGRDVVEDVVEGVLVGGVGALRVALLPVRGARDVADVLVEEVGEGHEAVRTVGAGEPAHGWAVVGVGGHRPPCRGRGRGRRRSGGPRGTDRQGGDGSGACGRAGGGAEHPARLRKGLLVC
jgi:hypothetical protein